MFKIINIKEQISKRENIAISEKSIALHRSNYDSVKKKGLTLIEVLVTLAIMSILIGISVYSLNTQKYKLNSEARLFASDIRNYQTKAITNYKKAIVYINKPDSYTLSCDNQNKTISFDSITIDHVKNDIFHFSAMKTLHPGTSNSAPLNFTNITLSNNSGSCVVTIKYSGITSLDCTYN